MRKHKLSFTAALVACGILAVLALSACGGNPAGPDQPGPPPTPMPTPPPPTATTLTDIVITPVSGSTVPYSERSTETRMSVTGQYTIGPADIAPDYSIAAYVSVDGVNTVGGSSTTGGLTELSGEFSSKPIHWDRGVSQTNFVIVRLDKLPQGRGGDLVFVKQVAVPWVFKFE